MQKEKPIYLQTINEIETNFSTNINKGLSSKNAKRRLTEYGENYLEEESRISIWKIFFKQFESIVMLLLAAAAIASFFINEIVEGVAVLVVILITAILGLIMEYKAGKSIEALQKRVHEEAKVIRDGEFFNISTKKLVPGDVVSIEEGDQISADGRIVEANELYIDESMLTGESDLVNKNTEIPVNDENIQITDRKNMVFMGTAVLKGSGRFIVTATGNEAEIGKLSQMLQDTKSDDTPLEKRLEQTGRYLILITLLITAVIGVTGLISGKPIYEMLKISIALAIAAVPEGLPAAATITLAIGMSRMAKKKALVRNLPAVETLGSATILCTDKTGTLTENKMVLRKLVIGNRDISISGTGYEPEGEFTDNGERLNPTNDKEIILMLRAGILCSEAELNKNDEGKWEIVGDPTEGALIVGAKKAGLVRNELEKEYVQLEVAPFDSERKFMASLYETKNGNKELFLKGAPEVILEMSEYVYEDNEKIKITDEKKQNLQNQSEKIAKQSYRMLGIAYKNEEFGNDNDIHDEYTDGLVFLGFTGMIDPPREGVKDSINLAAEAGIRTLMLTGDQQETAIGIAKSVGIQVNEDAMMKDITINELSIESLKKNLKQNSVYARVTPEDKLHIISALKEMGEIVAMTGDGVNDAPALKKADIGVSMGIRGTTVAKEASDMILLDDRFSTIVEAVRQGRVIFDNIQKFIHYLLSCNLSEILFIFLSIIFGLPMPLIALQILWLNVVTGVFPALAMAWESPEDGVMQKKPKKPKSSIITNRYKFLIGFQGLIISLGPLIAYLASLNRGFDVEVARTIGFMTLAMVHLLQVVNVRRKNGLGFDKTFIKNKYLIGSLLLTFSLQIIAIYVPLIQNILKTTSLSANMWVYVIIGAIVPITFLQLIAIIQKKRKFKKNNN